MRECPKKDMVRVNGFCTECGLTHLIVDCPNNPDKRPKATLNVLSTIPSSGSEEEPKVEVKVVTRAQRKRAKGQSQEESNPEHVSVSNLWKARRAKAKARREENLNAVTTELEQVREQLEQRGEAAAPKPAKKLKSVSSGGSVIAEKVFEPLDAILKAFEARL